MNIKKVSSYLTGTVQGGGGPATRAGGDEKSVSGSGSADRVQLSSNYQGLVQAKKLISAGNEVRVDRVTPLRDQLESGDYEINADAIAEKMIEEALI